MSILNELEKKMNEGVGAKLNLDITSCDEFRLNNDTGEFDGCPYYQRDREFGPMCKLFQFQHDGDSDSSIYDGMINSDNLMAKGGCPLGLNTQGK